MIPNLLEMALQYAERGWLVLPLHSPVENGCSCKNPACKSIGKHPRNSHGLKEANKDPLTIKRWWETWPQANIGVCTGRESGLVVLDIDPRHDGNNSLEQLVSRNGKLPETLESLTGGGGKHIFFSHPGKEFQIKNSAGLAGLPGLDIRGDGGYIVAPPSLHSSGKSYEWEMSSELDQISPIPAWLFPMTSQFKSHPNIKNPNENGLKVTYDSSNVIVRSHSPEMTSGMTSGQIPEGTRNSTFTSLAGTMRNRGMSREAIHSALLIENRKCSPPLEESEINRIVESISKYSPDLTENLTDSGNARRLISLFGHKLRFVPAWGKWLIYDGKKWVKDSIGQIQQLAKETVQNVYLEAFQEPNEEKRKNLGRWAKQSESASTIRSMIYLAQSEPGIPVSPLQLDSDDWLFNCANGTLDLKTGDLLPHNPGNLLTKISSVEFDPEVRSPLFEEFLIQVTGGSLELITFLQRMAGYSLTGDTREEKLFFLYGPSATGKRTFIEALKATLGDYASTSDFETFIKKQSSSGPRNDIARLAGVRFVSSVEVDDGKQLAEALIKSITGGDKITSRFLFQESFEFLPKFKLLLAANHKPKLRSDDDAIWRRILQVPFDQSIPEGKRDPSIKARLRDTSLSGPAILAWAVKGCQAWLALGLGIPPAVTEATEAYREEMDPLREFVQEKCSLSPENWVSSRDLFQEYFIWAKDNGLRHPLEQRAFGSNLKAMGLKQATRNSGRVRGWLGIGLFKPGDVVTQSDTNLETPAEVKS